MTGVDRMDWKGRWIWCEGPGRPRNFYLCLRKVFNIHGDVASARAFCVGDSRYRLSVNGAFVGRGPARSDPRWQSYDDYDLKPYLQRGQNVIAVVVHHIGEGTFSYMPGRGGFLFQMNGETTRGKAFEVVSDRSWRVKPELAWDDRSPRISASLGFTVNYDARRADRGWMELEFDDGEWAPATVIGKAGMKPWSWLTPRDIPPLREEVIYPCVVLDQGQCVQNLGPFYMDFRSLITPHQDVVAYAGTYIWTPQSGEGELSIGSTGGVKVWIGSTKVVDRHVHGPSEPEQERVRVFLEEGWNPILVKVDQGMGDWNLHFALVGSHDLIYSVDQGMDTVAPAWMVIGPFDNEMVGDECVGFQFPYPPEREMDFRGRYEGKGGQIVQWVIWDSVAQRMARERHVPLQRARIEDPDAMLNDGPETARVELLDPTEVVYVTVDFGREVTGYPFIDLEAPPGTVVDLGYSEVLEDGRVACFRNGVKYADRYVTGKGRACFEVFGRKGFRYMQLTFRGVTGLIHVHSVGMTFSTYPVEYRGEFHCSDERLNRIWDVGRSTVQLCMHDAYEDDPWRGQAQWWGAARVEALVNYYAFGDSLLMARGLRQIAQSQRADGLTEGMYPDGLRMQWVPILSLLWVISLWEYYIYTADEELVRKLYPNVQRLLGWFRGYVRDRGILEDVPGGVDTDYGGGIAPLNFFYARALEMAAQMAQVMDDEPSRTRYTEQFNGVQAAIHQYLWSEERGGYTDGPGSEGMSPHANILAVLFDLAEERYQENIVRHVFNDPEDVIQIGSPSFMFYGLDALFHSGYMDRALKLIRERWGAMLDGGTTSWWEQFDPVHSCCYGGSAGPTYFLSAEVLGVKPLSVGFSRVWIRPYVGDLEWAEGVIPTVRGDIRVSWKRSEEFRLRVEVPGRCVAVIGVPKLDRLRPRIELGKRVIWEKDQAISHERIRRAWEDEEYVWFEMRRAGRHIFVGRGV